MIDLSNFDIPVNGNQNKNSTVDPNKDPVRKHKNEKKTALIAGRKLVDISNGSGNKNIGIKISAKPIKNTGKSSPLQKKNSYFSQDISVSEVSTVNNKIFLNRNQRVFADLDKNELCHIDPEAFSAEQQKEFNDRVEKGELVKGFYDVKENKYHFEKTGINVKGKLGLENAVVKFNDGASQRFKDNLSDIKNKHKNDGRKAELAQHDKEHWDDLNAKYDRAINELRLSQVEALNQNDQEVVTSDEESEDRKQDFIGVTKFFETFLRDLKGNRISDKQIDEVSVVVKGLMGFIKQKLSEEAAYRKEAEIIEKYKKFLEAFLSLMGEIKNKNIKSERVNVDRLDKELRSKMVLQGVIKEIIDSFDELTKREPLSLKPLLVVFNVDSTTFLAGLPSAGGYSAETAEQGKIKLIANPEHLIDPSKTAKCTSEVFDTKKPMIVEVSIQIIESIEKAETLREAEEVNRVEETRRIASLRTLEQAHLIEMGIQIVEEAGRVSFLHSLVSDGKKARDWVNKTFLLGHLNVEKLNEELVKLHVRYDLEELRKLAISMGHIRTLPELQREAVWKNRKVVQVMWSRG